MAARETPSGGSGNRLVMHGPYAFENMFDDAVEQAVADYREREANCKRIPSPHSQDSCAEHAPDGEDPCIAQMGNQCERADHADGNSARYAVSESLIYPAQRLARADFIGDRGEHGSRTDNDGEAHRQIDNQQDLGRQAAVFPRQSVTLNDLPHTYYHDHRESKEQREH